MQNRCNCAYATNMLLASAVCPPIFLPLCTLTPLLPADFVTTCIPVHQFMHKQEGCAPELKHMRMHMHMHMWHFYASALFASFLDSWSWSCTHAGMQTCLCSMVQGRTFKF